MLMRLLSFVLLALAYGYAPMLPAYALDRNYCTTAEHGRAAFPLLKRLTAPETTEAAASRRIEQMIADDAKLLAQKAELTERLKGAMSSVPYKAGLLNIICKHISLEEFQALQSGNLLPEQKASLDGKMAAMQPDIDRLLADVATTGK